ncbi:nucleotidyltransferase domain-containing protein [Kitasatospora xanthocidica]|uniref:nucleotidyltransferase domain-containing protein n=1 Tax=Kitasatospora xanthocidica TaxID=83382 RepID=UPI0036F04C53
MDVALLDALPAHVRTELARRGVALPAVAGLIDADLDEPVLLTGSYASGEANPTSDLDVLVLTRRPRARRVPGTVNHPSILGDSFDGLVADLPVNIEYVAEGRLEDLGHVTRTATGGGQVDLPNLQSLELRLAHRVHSGIPLAGAERLDRLRRLVDIEVVRASAAALAFVGAMSLLEDTTVLESPARELMLRGSAEALLMSGVNAFGRITHDGKHLMRRAAALAGDPGVPALFAERERLLFVDRLPQREALELVLDLAQELYVSFPDERCPALVTDMLAPFRESWAWAGRPGLTGRG